jgi:hypothetical protein
MPLTAEQVAALFEALIDALGWPLITLAVVSFAAGYAVRWLSEKSV